jgi:hypothetical protein
MSFFFGSTHPTMSDSTQQGEGAIDKAVDINLANETKVFWCDGFLTGFIGRGSNSVWFNSVW